MLKETNEQMVSTITSLQSQLRGKDDTISELEEELKTAENDLNAQSAEQRNCLELPLDPQTATMEQIKGAAQWVHVAVAGICQPTEHANHNVHAPQDAQLQNELRETRSKLDALIAQNLSDVDTISAQGRELERMRPRLREFDEYTNQMGSGQFGLKCSCCMSNFIDMVYVACGHASTCKTCYDERNRELRDCPICRTRSACIRIRH